MCDGGAPQPIAVGGGTSIALAANLDGLAYTMKAWQTNRVATHNGQFLPQTGNDPVLLDSPAMVRNDTHQSTVVLACAHELLTIVPSPTPNPFPGRCDTVTVTGMAGLPTSDMPRTLELLSGDIMTVDVVGQYSTVLLPGDTLQIPGGAPVDLWGFGSVDVCGNDPPQGCTYQPVAEGYTYPGGSSAVDVSIVEGGPMTVDVGPGDYSTTLLPGDTLRLDAGVGATFIAVGGMLLICPVEDGGGGGGIVDPPEGWDMCVRSETQGQPGSPNQPETIWNPALENFGFEISGERGQAITYPQGVQVRVRLFAGGVGASWRSRSLSASGWGNKWQSSDTERPTSFQGLHANPSTLYARSNATPALVDLCWRSTSTPTPTPDTASTGTAIAGTAIAGATATAAAGPGPATPTATWTPGPSPTPYITPTLTPTPVAPRPQLPCPNPQQINLINGGIESLTLHDGQAFGVSGGQAHFEPDANNAAPGFVANPGAYTWSHSELASDWWAWAYTSTVWLCPPPAGSVPTPTPTEGPSPSPTWGPAVGGEPTGSCPHGIDWTARIQGDQRIRIEPWQWSSPATFYVAGYPIRMETVAGYRWYYPNQGLIWLSQAERSSNVWIEISRGAWWDSGLGQPLPGNAWADIMICRSPPPTQTNTPTNTATNTPNPTMTEFPTPAPDPPPPPTTTPGIGETQVCLPATVEPTQVTYAMPNLGIAVPTMVALPTYVTATLQFSATDLITLVTIIEGGIATPMSGIISMTDGMDWSGGAALAATSVSMAEPVLSWFAILNPQATAWQLEGGPLWALAPVIGPVLPIVVVMFVVLMIRFVLFVINWLLKLFDVVVKLIELIPGQ